MQASHLPVLCREVIMGLNPNGKTLLDMTYGRGGHTRSLLKAGASKIIALDMDKTAFQHANELARFRTDIIPIHGKFSQVAELVKSRGFSRVDGVLFDLGVCSHQLDDGTRGFSFLKDGPLDMRMDQSDQNAYTAELLVNQNPPQMLLGWLRDFGEEPAAESIVKAICVARKKKPILSTQRLAGIIAKVAHSDEINGSGKIHPATRTFQALRIVVNSELEELKRGLRQVESLLDSGGRLVVISFHSLEDRIVSKFISGYEDSELSRKIPPPQSRKLSLGTGCNSAYTPDASTIPSVNPRFIKITQSPVTPSENEIGVNRRSRSAKLRIAEKK